MCGDPAGRGGLGCVHLYAWCCTRARAVQPTSGSAWWRRGAGGARGAAQQTRRWAVEQQGSVARSAVLLQALELQKKVEQSEQRRERAARRWTVGRCFTICFAGFPFRFLGRDQAVLNLILIQHGCTRSRGLERTVTLLVGAADLATCNCNNVSHRPQPLAFALVRTLAAGRPHRYQDASRKDACSMTTRAEASLTACCSSRREPYLDV